MAADPRAVRDPVLYNAALSDACAAMQRWYSNGGSLTDTHPLTDYEITTELIQQVMSLRQPLK